MQLDKESLIYKSGDFFLNDKMKTFLYTYIYGNKNTIIYVNYWSIVHLLSGVITYLLLDYFNIKSYIIFGLIIHTLWEIWQISINMTKLNVRGLIDICMDTIFFLTGMWLSYKYIKY